MQEPANTIVSVTWWNPNAGEHPALNSVFCIKHRHVLGRFQRAIYKTQELVYGERVVELQSFPTIRDRNPH